MNLLEPIVVIMNNSMAYGFRTKAVKNTHVHLPLYIKIKSIDVTRAVHARAIALPLSKYERK